MIEERLAILLCLNFWIDAHSLLILVKFKETSLCQEFHCFI